MNKHFGLEAAKPNVEAWLGVMVEAAAECLRARAGLRDTLRLKPTRLVDFSDSRFGGSALGFGRV